MCDSAPSVACTRNQSSLSRLYACKAANTAQRKRYTRIVSHLLAAAASSGCADQAARGAAPAKPARTATLLPLPELLPRRKPCAHPRKLRLQVHHTEKHTTEL